MILLIYLDGGLMKLFLEERNVPYNQEFKDTLVELGYTLQDTPDNKTQVMVSTNKKILNNGGLYPSLQYVQLTSAGFDYFDIEQLKAQGVKISNARGVYSHGIAEFVVTRLLEVYQDLRGLNSSQRQAEWNRDINLVSLRNLKGAILGTGSIAKEVGRLLRVFGPILEGYNRQGTQHEEFDRCYPLSEFDQKSSSYDFIVITLPLNASTKHFFNKERLLSLNKDAVLVNIARGPIIKEDDLISILDTHLKAAILDVFEKEPLDEGSPLWTHPKTYLSSHISFKNNFYIENVIALILSNLEKYILNKEVTHLI